MVKLTFKSIFKEISEQSTIFVRFVIICMAFYKLIQLQGQSRKQVIK